MRGTLRKADYHLDLWKARISWSRSSYNTYCHMIMPSLPGQAQAGLGSPVLCAVTILGRYPFTFSYSVTCFILLVFSRSHRIDVWPSPLLRNLSVTSHRNQTQSSLSLPQKTHNLDKKSKAWKRQESSETTGTRDSNTIC